MRDPDTKLLDKAYKFLARRDHSCFELKQKLIRKGWSSASVEKIIEYLKSKNYLNDAEFARKYVEYKCLISPRGYYKLRTELKIKGVDEGVISQAINECEVSELDLAKDFLERKARSLKKFSKEEREKKIFQKLKSRGFGLDTIYKALKDC